MSKKIEVKKIKKVFYQLTLIRPDGSKYQTNSATLKEAEANANYHMSQGYAFVSIEEFTIDQIQVTK